MPLALDDLLNVAARILDRETVAPGDNFFELGGDSLGAVRLVDVIEEDFGVAVDLAEFFEASDFKTFVDALG